MSESIPRVIEVTRDNAKTYHCCRSCMCLDICSGKDFITCQRFMTYVVRRSKTTGTVFHLQGDKIQIAVAPLDKH